MNFEKFLYTLFDCASNRGQITVFFCCFSTNMNYMHISEWPYQKTYWCKGILNLTYSEFDKEFKKCKTYRTGNNEDEVICNETGRDGK